jgi:hypothetical protein
MAHNHSKTITVLFALAGKRRRKRQLRRIHRQTHSDAPTPRRASRCSPRPEALGERADRQRQPAPTTAFLDLSKASTRVLHIRAWLGLSLLESTDHTAVHPTHLILPAREGEGRKQILPQIRWQGPSALSTRSATYSATPNRHAHVWERQERETQSDRRTSTDG